jgi:hypothetical protein
LRKRRSAFFKIPASTLPLISIETPFLAEWVKSGRL